MCVVCSVYYTGHMEDHKFTYHWFVEIEKYVIQTQPTVPVGWWQVVRCALSLELSKHFKIPAG